MTPTALTEAMCLDALRQVDDPELGINIVDMGLIYGLTIEGGHVAVKMTLTSPGCPMSQSLACGVQLALQGFEPVQTVDVELVWDPPWSPDMITEAGRTMVGMN